MTTWIDEIRRVVEADAALFIHGLTLRGPPVWSVLVWSPYFFQEDREPEFGHTLIVL
jgi:hypothetical protein